MKRNMDLVREILLRAENAPYGTLSAESFSDAGYEEPLVAAHFELLDEAGLIEANLLTLEGDGTVSGSVNRLTWIGHDYLDTIRSTTVWERTKKLVADKVGSAPFEILKQVASKIVLKQLDSGAE